MRALACPLFLTSPLPIPPLALRSRVSDHTIHPFTPTYYHLHGLGYLFTAFQQVALIDFVHVCWIPILPALIRRFALYMNSLR
jgi:hypothetical protein